jgi:regulator of replication initiation timing
MSGQAKARGSSPFWEGVVVLPNTDAKEQSANLLEWKKEYEKATGHQVLHLSIHLDEGYLDATGHPQYNPHAHVIVSRMNEKNRVIELGRKQLAEVQDLTAEILQMERGSTLAERGEKRGRAHIGPKEFRLMADEARLSLEKPKADLARLQKKSKEWSDADLEKIKVLEAKLDGEPARLAAALAAQKAKLDEQYRLDREALKASGEATQADYQQLKKAHEKALDELTASQEQADKVPGLVADLATAQTEAAKVPGLVEKYKTLRTKALAIQEQRNDLAKKVDTMTQENQSLQKENERLAARREEVSRITLQTLKVDFGVDITPAEKLKGEDLERWREAAEDKVFEQQLAEMKTPAPAKRPVEAPNRPVEALKTQKAPNPTSIQEKTPREAFMALYQGVKLVLVGMIDGMRLDAAEGRLGLFSSHSTKGPRNQVLCEVPSDKVMPRLGEVFNSRAVPEKGRGGIGD